VWDVWEWRIVHSTTVMRLNVLMGMTCPIAINQMPQVVQIMCVCMVNVGMGLLKEMKNVRLEEEDVVGVCVWMGGIQMERRTV
jgi:hypothetical protein